MFEWFGDDPHRTYPTTSRIETGKFKFKVEIEIFYFRWKCIRRVGGEYVEGIDCCEHEGKYQLG